MQTVICLLIKFSVKSTRNPSVSLLPFFAFLLEGVVMGPVVPEEGQPKACRQKWTPFAPVHLTHSCPLIFLCDLLDAIPISQRWKLKVNQVTKK